MIIDFHTHTFPDKLAPSVIPTLAQTAHIQPYTDGTALGLITRAKASRVDLSVVLPVATSPRQVPGINAFAQKTNESTTSTGLLSFGAMHPDFDQWKEELIKLAEAGFKGIKLHPVYQKIPIDDIRTLRILDKAAELGLLVVTHSGIDLGYPDSDYCFPQRIRRAMDQVPQITLICAHMGGWKVWKDALTLLADTNVYLDTSFSVGVLDESEDAFHSLEYRTLLNQNQFLTFVKEFGVNRILFGTDSPWDSQEKHISWIKDLPLAQADIEAILGENARHLLNL